MTSYKDYKKSKRKTYKKLQIIIQIKGAKETDFLSVVRPVQEGPYRLSVFFMCHCRFLCEYQGEAREADVFC